MSAIVRFSALYGVGTERLPVSYVLEIDGFNILLDCGWDDKFEQETVAALNEFGSKIDAVLVSHGDLNHIGALPYAVASCGLDAPVYSTLPVWRMGQMALYDAHESHVAGYPFDLFNLDDVDRAFDRFHHMKYQQHLPLQGKGAGIIITPYAAGHTMGGSVWKIKKDAEEIVYAVDFNHKKERLVNATYLQNLSRPSHLILGANQALVKPPTTINASRNEMVDSVIETLKLGGNVLLPLDTAGRILEVSLQLEEAFTTRKLLKQFRLAILHHVARSTFEKARSMIEWTSDTLANRFDLQKENPFEFKDVVICQDRSEVDALSSPKVVLTSLASLEYGFARDIFLDWAGSSRNLVLFTDSIPRNTLADQVMSLERGGNVNVNIRKRVQLEGAELREWREARRRAADEAAARNAAAVVQADEQSDSESDSSSDGGENGLNQRLVTDVAAPSSQLLFPWLERRKNWDDYGEIVDMKQFMIGEDPGGVDVDMDAMERFIPNGGAGIQTPVVEEIPTKYVERQASIPIRCSVRKVNMSGIADGRSVKNIVASVGPRRVIVVHGTLEESEFLVQQLSGESRLQLKPDEIISPVLGKTVDLTSDTSVYRLTLHDTIFSESLWHRIGGVDVAYVTGALRVDKETENIELRGASEDVKGGHPAVFVGDVELRELKEILTREGGMRAEFAGGALCVHNKETEAVVLVKKVGPAEVLVEGAFCEEYFSIRELLYGRFVVL